MNNNFYKIVTTIQETFKQNPLVNTIVYARNEEKDVFKKNIYPLVHISPVDSPWTNEASNELSFEIGVLVQRTQDNRNKDTKFEGNDNIIDNHNTTYAILNEFLTVMSKDNDDLVYLTDVSSITPIFLEDVNGLDGMLVTASFKLINQTEVC